MALERRLEKVEAGLDTLSGKIDDGLRRLWQARDGDKERAREDAERRQTELLDAIREVNGTVRDNEVRITKIETRHEQQDRMAGLDPRARVAIGAGSAGGAAGLVYALIEVVKFLGS